MILLKDAFWEMVILRYTATGIQKYISSTFLLNDRRHKKVKLKFKNLTINKLIKDIYKI